MAWARRGLLLASGLAAITLLWIGAGPSRAAKASSAAELSATRVWVLAHARHAGCLATLRVRAGGHTAIVRVRGTASRRYVTSLTAARRGSITTSQRAQSRCRIVVSALGLLPASSGRHGDRGAPLSPRLTRALTPASPLPAAVAPAESQTRGATPVAPPVEPEVSRGGMELGTFDVVGPSQMRAWAASGGTAVVVPVVWAQAQPARSAEVSLSSAGNSGQDVLSEIEQAHEAGLHVYLELDLQYPPAWVKQSVPSYVDQSGTRFTSQVPGQDVRDWVWSQLGREAVAGFVSGAMRALAPAISEVTGIRVGGGMDGEMQYPDDDSTVSGQPSFWGYDLPAQTGVGLAEGAQSTPLPGYVYGQGSAAQDATWASWYERSLGEFVQWYITLLRTDGWSGPTYVLEPSYGVRQDWSRRSFAYEQQVANGTDYSVQMASYETLADVWPWSTWADDAEPYYYPGDAVESDLASWRELLVLAQQRGLAAHIMGENTGGGGAAAIERLTSGSMRAGYRGIFYLDYPALTADGDSLLGSLTADFHAVLAGLAD